MSSDSDKDSSNSPALGTVSFSSNLMVSRDLFVERNWNRSSLRSSGAFLRVVAEDLELSVVPAEHVLSLERAVLRAAIDLNESVLTPPLTRALRDIHSECAGSLGDPVEAGADEGDVISDDETTDELHSSSMSVLDECPQRVLNDETDDFSLSYSGSPSASMESSQQDEEDSAPGFLWSRARDSMGYQNTSAYQDPISSSSSAATAAASVRSMRTPIPTTASLSRSPRSQHSRSPVSACASFTDPYLTSPTSSLASSDPYHPHSTFQAHETPHTPKLTGFSQYTVCSVADTWNERFQVALSHVRSARESLNPALLQQSYTALLHVTEDFDASALAYAKIIISELFLPVEKRTFRPLLGETGAGGDKYVIHDVLFKITQKNRLYTSHEEASKVPSHELKGLQSYLNCGLHEFSLPLLAIVDFRGFRVCAVSILPVDSSTLQYGSHDRGCTVSNSQFVPQLRDNMNRAASLINIKLHRAGRIPVASAMVASPIDLEVHLAHDGRTYLLDFHRVMPPEGNANGSNRSPAHYLTHLLRPEFVQNYSVRNASGRLCKVPLCSDAFSPFTQPYPLDHQKHIDEVNEATSYLFSIVIPESVQTLIRSRATDWGGQLTEFMHSRGINMRHLDRMVAAARDHTAAEAGEVTNRTRMVLSELLVEKIARHIKRLMRQNLRARMELLKIPVEAPYRRIVIAQLNQIFGALPSDGGFHLSSYRFFKRTFPGLLDADFSPSFPVALVTIFRRVSSMLRLHFTDSFWNSLNSNTFQVLEPVDSLDLVQVKPRLKSLDLARLVKAEILLAKGMEKPTERARQAFFRQARSLLRGALRVYSNNPFTLLSLSQAELLLASECSCVCPSRKTHPSATTRAQALFDVLQAHKPSDSLVDVNQLRQIGISVKHLDRAQLYLEKSLVLSPKNVDALGLLALIQICQQKLADASVNLLTALCHRPCNLRNLHLYASLLAARGRSEQSALFFERFQRLCRQQTA
mmetsp:Transcript_8088/g.25059  ORF Transcript_8088/g.25059 Transcript_8088/m.25059 type:complete len:981 (+) Transcript_8088:176-3118(+)